MPDEKEPAGRWAQLGVTGTVVDRRLAPLQEGALKDVAANVAALARLRRGVGKRPGEVGDILRYTLDPDLAELDAGDDATAAETAAHIAITLYALHQQSQQERMHRRGHGLGRSARSLYPRGGEPGPGADPILRRFQALGTSESLDELVHHLRGLVQLLRGKQIPLDYGLLADQLAGWQQPGGPERIRMVWGRDFYRAPKTSGPGEPADPPDPAAAVAST